MKQAERIMNLERFSKENLILTQASWQPERVDAVWEKENDVTNPYFALYVKRLKLSDVVSEKKVNGITTTVIKINKNGFEKLTVLKNYSDENRITNIGR